MLSVTITGVGEGAKGTALWGRRVTTFGGMTDDCITKWRSYLMAKTKGQVVRIPERVFKLLGKAH